MQLIQKAPIHFTMLDGRTRIFCFEKELVGQVLDLPQDLFVARDGINAIENLEKFVDENPGGFFSFSLRLRGGKGGDYYFAFFLVILIFVSSIVI